MPRRISGSYRKLSFLGEYSQEFPIIATRGRSFAAPRFQGWNDNWTKALFCQVFTTRAIKYSESYKRVTLLKARNKYLLRARGEALFEAFEASFHSFKSKMTDNFSFIVEGVLLTLVSTFGLVGNLLSIVVLTRSIKNSRSMNNTTAISIPSTSGPGGQTFSM